MSSLTRTIQRAAKRSKNYLGRGGKLGHTNPKAPTKLHSHARAMMNLRTALGARA